MNVINKEQQQKTSGESRFFFSCSNKCRIQAEKNFMNLSGYHE